MAPQQQSRRLKPSVRRPPQTRDAGPQGGRAPMSWSQEPAGRRGFARPARGRSPAPHGPPAGPAHRAPPRCSRPRSARFKTARKQFDSHADHAARCRQGSHTGGRRGLLGVFRTEAWRWPLHAQPSETRPCHTSPSALPQHTQRTLSQL